MSDVNKWAKIKVGLTNLPAVHYQSKNHYNYNYNILHINNFGRINPAISKDSILISNDNLSKIEDALHSIKGDTKNIKKLIQSLSDLSNIQFQIILSNNTYYLAVKSPKIDQLLLIRLTYIFDKYYVYSSIDTKIKGTLLIQIQFIEESEIKDFRCFDKRKKTLHKFFKLTKLLEDLNDITGEKFNIPIESSEPTVEDLRKMLESTLENTSNPEKDTTENDKAEESPNQNQENSYELKEGDVLVMENPETIEKNNDEKVVAEITDSEEVGNEVTTDARIICNKEISSDQEATDNDKAAVNEETTVNEKVSNDEVTSNVVISDGETSSEKETVADDITKKEKKAEGKEPNINKNRRFLEYFNGDSEILRRTFNC